LLRDKGLRRGEDDPLMRGDGAEALPSRRGDGLINELRGEFSPGTIGVREVLLFIPLIDTQKERPPNGKR